MSFLNLAKERFSTRDFLPKPIEEDKLLEILESARISPSAVNRQPWHFIVVRDENMKEKIVEAYPRDWFAKAPVYIVACGDHIESWKREDGKDYCDVDVAIAVTHIMLAATDLGLGTCYVGHFDADICREALGLPKHIEPIAIIPLGYPAKKDSTKRFDTRRKALSEIVHFDGYDSSVEKL